MRLFLFNPENDLALANGDPHFIAPASARRMAADLDLLPLWWAGEGDVVWTEAKERAVAYLRTWQELLPAVDFWCEGEVAGTWDFSPWGYSPMLLERLRRMGAPAEWRLSAEEMETYRRLSSRALAVELLAALRADFPIEVLCGESRLCHLEAEAAAWITRYPLTLLKMPWSGSGKGLRQGFGCWEAPLSGWVRNVLRTQGAVVVEPLCDKVADFAMEFESDGRGTVRYTGLSLFITHAQGAYAGNVVADEAVKEKMLHGLVPESLCSEIRTYLTRWFSDRVGFHYRGPLGVDMMVCTSILNSSGPCLHPCVEINLRRTMGDVAVHLGRKLVPGRTGLFRVDYFGRPEDLMADHLRRLAATPPTIERGRMSDGYFPLTPVEDGTCYRAHVEVGGVVEWGRR